MRVASATMIQQALGSQDRNWLRDGALVLIGTALLALSAKIQIPFYPVPMTMQSLVVMMIGAAYGWRLGGLTLLAYLAEGAMGLPVFASGAGLAYMVGPTAGYLVSFVLAAMLTGYLSERGYTHSVLGAVAVLSLGHAINLALGFAWLATLMGPELAFAKGVAPFAYATVLKVGLGAALLPASWWAVRTFRKL
jgi:biotin transport system substrate-specific component